MMLDTILVGHGPDMYVVNFPQRDFAGRLNGFFITGINDKPHNMFLQIGINTGVVSLLALMSVYGIYVLDSVKRYWKRDYESLTDYFGVVTFAAILGYLVAGLFNDQIISVAPLFYALTGIGIAVNWLIAEDEDDLPNQG
jgi:O-antigen ligase